MGICKISWFFLVLGLASAEYCPPLWTSYGKDCYRFFGPHKTWLAAEKHCQEFFTQNGQGHLASIHNPGENQLLIQLWTTSMVPNEEPYPGHSVWIGHNDRANEDKFVWTDGTPFDFTDWHDNEPNDVATQGEDCGSIWKNEDLVDGWNDDQCNRARSYLCKMPSQ